MIVVTILIGGGAGGIGRGLAADERHAARAGRNNVTSRPKLSMRRWVCSYLLWRLQRSEMSLVRRMGNLDDERLEVLGIRRHEIESLLTATLKVLAQAASEPPAAAREEDTVNNAPGSHNERQDMLQL